MPTFYRVVKTDPPTEQDMLSLVAQGRRPRRTDPKALRQAEGLSVYATPDGARATARRFWPRMGTLIAMLDVPEGGPIAYELTGDDGHYTLWGEPAAILATVQQVIPVEG